MKCDTCGNSKIWIGDMMTGGLACEHCLNNDDIYKEATAEIFLSDGSSMHYDPAGGLDITVLGGGGGGGCSNVGAIVGHGGSGGAQAGGAGGQVYKANDVYAPVPDVPATPNCPVCKEEWSFCSCLSMAQKACIQYRLMQYDKERIDFYLAEFKKIGGLC